MMAGVHVCQIDETQMGEEFMTMTTTNGVFQQITSKRLKKEFSYGPAPKALVEAVRKQLRALVESPTLEDDLGTIGRFANQAEDMLLMLRKPEARMRSEHAITMPGVTSDASMNAETYGASIIREAIPLLTQYLKKNDYSESPTSLVAAIEMARSGGMTDVAAELEKKLLGKPLDGPRPTKALAPLVVQAGSQTDKIVSDLLAGAKKRRGRKKHLLSAANGSAT